MSELNDMLTQMEDRAIPIASQALYTGAGIMADEVNKWAETIKTGPGSNRQDARYATPEEKEIVMNAAAGIAKFHKTDGEVDTSIGFGNAGYAELNGKTVPIPLIVNSINSGTSFMHKQPFIRKAASQGAPKAMKAMKASIADNYAAFLAKATNTGKKD